MVKGEVIVVLVNLIHLVVGVGSPLDKVAQELAMMQETMSSVQESLITSVSLIQGETSATRKLPQ